MVILVTSLKGRNSDGIPHSWSQGCLDARLDALFLVLFHLLCSLPLTYFAATRSFSTEAF